MSRSATDPVGSDELMSALAECFAKEQGAEQIAPEHRGLASACLQTIARHGFEVRAAPSTAQRTITASTSVESSERLQSSARLRDVLNVWREVSRSDTAESADVYAQIGERVLTAGEPLLAYDILKSGLKHWPDHLRLRQLRALALARSGAPRPAARWLRELIAAGHEDDETLGLLARTCKDLWETETDPATRRASLSDAHRLYRQGYDYAVREKSVDGAIYNGINAATTALLLGDKDVATRLAREVAEACKTRLDLQSDYWSLATLGECAVIAGRVDEAAEYYTDAVTLAGRDYANIASTRRNAGILLRHLGQDSKLLSEWFPILKVAVFTGHLIDQPGQPLRFPHSQIEAVQSRLTEILDEHHVGFGFSAAACGGDLLFLDVLQKREAEAFIVLPLPQEQFAKSSVDVDPQHDWLPDMQRALDHAAQVTIVNDYSRSARPMHFEFANRVMTGLARLHARSLGAEVVPITVWDERTARGPGGTATLVELWRQLGWEPQIINPLQMASASVTIPTEPETPPDDLDDDADPDGFEMDVRAMLFADVVGYSKLAEEEIPLFVCDFMAGVGQCLRDSGCTIESSNTWGDAIYIVFRSVEDAGLTALRIAEHVSSVDWQSRGFSAPLQLRTGLHVGPVLGFRDPVTQLQNHSGAHVSRAARIEPITPPGEVYASEAFAAVAAADDVSGFRCEYVGVTPMAKSYGDFPTYHVRRVEA